MDKTLREMLYELRLFMYSSIDLCKTVGNGFGDARWRITHMSTVGGEKFKFSQPDYMGREGSGIYFDTVDEAEAYAQECVRNFFKSYSRIKIGNFDPNDYDWHPQGLLAEV